MQRILADASDPSANRITVDLETMTVRSRSHQAVFSLAERHRRMFLEGLDMIGASLTLNEQILAFSAAHWQQRPWLKDVALKTRVRLNMQAGSAAE